MGYPRHTEKTRPTIVVPVFLKTGILRPVFSSISFLAHRSKLNPPLAGKPIDTTILHIMTKVLQ
jgi:hypothetical protein